MFCDCHQLCEIGYSKWQVVAHGGGGGDNTEEVLNEGFYGTPKYDLILN